MEPKLSHILSTYHHVTKIQIRYKDIDKQGHVNNAVYPTYFEIARTEYFKDVVRKKDNWMNAGFILATLQITYKKPLFLDDEIYCYSKISRFGNKSFDMENAIMVKKQNDFFELAAIGKTTMVCYDYELSQTITVPDLWKQLVLEFEK